MSYQLTLIFLRSSAAGLQLGDKSGIERLMDDKMIDKITAQVRKKFPEVTLQNPTIKSQKGGKGDEERFVLTYTGRAELPNGREMKRIVRVVADDRGRVLKMSTSK